MKRESEEGGVRGTKRRGVVEVVGSVGRCRGELEGGDDRLIVLSVGSPALVLDGGRRRNDDGGRGLLGDLDEVGNLELIVETRAFFGANDDRGCTAVATRLEERLGNQGRDVGGGLHAREEMTEGTRRDNTRMTRRSEGGQELKGREEGRGRGSVERGKIAEWRFIVVRIDSIFVARRILELTVCFLKLSLASKVFFESEGRLGEMAAAVVGLGAWVFDDEYMVEMGGVGRCEMMFACVLSV